MRRPVIAACIAACVCALPLLAHAQTIYKVQMPDGSILFTDTPPPEAKVLEERTSKATPPRAPASKTLQTPPAAPRPGTPAGAPAGTVNQLDNAAAEVTAAERDLTVARRKLELGREPLPGERLGLKGGGTRLSPAYEARLQVLEQDVAAAEARLRRAHDAKNATR